MKAIIIEDEKNVREGFVKLLNTFCPEIEVVNVAGDVESGIDIVMQSNFDILFLDINLPDGSGFDLLHRLKKRDFNTIFVTAYDQYAIDAFKISAVDYLLKPVSPDLLKKAIIKVKEQAQKTTTDDIIDVTRQRMHRNFSQTEKIILRGADNMQIVVIMDVIYCAAEGSYTKFYLQDNREIMVSMNLKEYEHLLEPYGFARCHHSFLINLYHVTSLQKADGGTVIMTGGISLPLSTRKKSNIVEALKERFVN